MQPECSSSIRIRGGLTALSVFLVATLCESNHAAAQGKAGALKAVVKLLTGLAAADSLSRSAESFEQRELVGSKLTGESETLKRLREQGFQTSDAAVFSAMFSLDTNESAVYWADWFSKSDVFFLVDIEGEGTHLAPQIRFNYQGGPILDRIIATDIKPGRRVVVRVMDDDTLSDEIWKQILRTRIDLAVGADAYATSYLPVSAGVNGQFAVQLLPASAPVIIDAADHLATMSFTVPDTPDGRWLADGELFDGQGRRVGTLQFASVWSIRGETSVLQNEHRASTKWMVFWGATGFVLLSLFLAMILKPAASTSGTPTS